MSTDINLSLDEIIRKNKSIRNFNPRKKQGQNYAGGRRNTVNGKINGFGRGKASSIRPRFQNNINRSRTTVRYSPYKRGDIESTWFHDLYEDGFVGKRIDYDIGGTQVIISNLDFGVTDSDLEELFLEMGPLVSCEIRYDKSGRSLGSGSVVFEERFDAYRAINQYNGIPLDGRPMKIEIAANIPGRLIGSRRLGAVKNRSAGASFSSGRGGRTRFNGGNRNGNFGYRNRRSGSANLNLSAEQLDAELDEYRGKKF